MEPGCDIRSQIGGERIELGGDLLTVKPGGDTFKDIRLVAAGECCNRLASILLPGQEVQSYLDASFFFVFSCR